MLVLNMNRRPTIDLYASDTLEWCLSLEVRVLGEKIAYYSVNGPEGQVWRADNNSTAELGRVANLTTKWKGEHLSIEARIITKGVDKLTMYADVGTLTVFVRGARGTRMRENMIEARKVKACQ